MKKNIQFSEGFELGFLGFVRALILGTATAPETNRSCCKKWGSVRSRSTYWICLLARSGPGNRIHLHLSLFKLSALQMCTSISTCHPKTNKLLDTYLWLLLYLTKNIWHQRQSYLATLQLFPPDRRKIRSGLNILRRYVTT